LRLAAGTRGCGFNPAGIAPALFGGGMSANTDSLKTELQALANTLTNTVNKYKCLEYIDQYIAALDAQATLSATDISSYSIAERTVNRVQQADMARNVARLESVVFSLLYGSTTYADMRVPLKQETGDEI
jgi:hypothetical protein